jgi:hypothetical protein
MALPIQNSTLPSWPQTDVRSSLGFRLWFRFGDDTEIDRRVSAARELSRNWAVDHETECCRGELLVRTQYQRPAAAG